MHSSMHAWLRLSVPLTHPLEARRSLLPILYIQTRAGSDRDTVVGSDKDGSQEDALAGQSHFFDAVSLPLTEFKAVSGATTHANVLW